jgi:hypothetical protein
MTSSSTSVSSIADFELLTCVLQHDSKTFYDASMPSWVPRYDRRMRKGRVLGTKSFVACDVGRSQVEFVSPQTLRVRGFAIDKVQWADRSLFDWRMAVHTPPTESLLSLLVYVWDKTVRLCCARQPDMEPKELVRVFGTTLIGFADVKGLTMGRRDMIDDILRLSSRKKQVEDPEAVTRELRKNREACYEGLAPVWP